MAIKNPQTWTRLKRIELRAFANHIGNETLKLMEKWPSTGEGREIKAATERITRRLDGQQKLQNIEFTFGELTASTDDFLRILNNQYFTESLAGLLYKTKDGVPVHLGSHLLRLIDEVAYYIDEYRASLPPPPTSGELAAASLAELVPEQKLGPASFEVVDGVVRVLHRNASPKREDVHIAEAAREELIASSETIAAFLSGSNYDARLIETVRDMQSRLKARQDVIRLGVAAISLQLVVERFEDELPDAWSARIQAFSLGVNMYVGQFPEWARFAENAAMAEYSVDDVSKLFQSGYKLVEELRGAGSAVDPEVPQTLTFLLEAIREPRRALKRTVFAVVRSVENLLSAVFRAFGVVLSGIPEGLRDGLKKGLTTATAFGLLIVAARAAVDVSPAAGRVLQTTWIEKAGKLIQEHLKKAD